MHTGLVCRSDLLDIVAQEEYISGLVLHIFGDLVVTACFHLRPRIHCVIPGTDQVGLAGRIVGLATGIGFDMLEEQLLRKDTAGREDG